MKSIQAWCFGLMVWGCSQWAFGQTFSGQPGYIFDNTTIDLPVAVNGLVPGTIDTVGFGLESVCINLTHTWLADLEISLVAPDGTTAVLVSGVGGGDDNFWGTCFQQNAAQSIVSGAAPFTGTFRPQGQMGFVNNQQNANGTWFLRVSDNYGADTGSVHSWSITFGNNPATYFSVGATDLPLVIINTAGQPIPNDPKIMARMKVIDNGPGNLNHVTDVPNAYNGWIGIEVRGNSSQSYPQKQYSVETRDSLGDNREVALLGMPIENDWILSAPYSDKAFIRNHLAYTLSREMGQYAARTRYCEMILNGEYKGVYLFMESIKRDSNRVDVAKLTNNDLTGDELTGGYILKIDWIGGPYWQSNFPPDPTAPNSNVVNFQMIEPDPDLAPNAQILYIQQYVDSFEVALNGPNFADPVNGWRKYAWESMFIDYHILNELAKNVDAYHLSTYFYKEKDSKGGKLRMGPVWDFNGGWRGADYCNAPTTSDWQYNEPNYCSVDMPIWWKRLLQDTLFTNRLRCRWDSLRSTVLDTTNIFHHMDSVSALVAQAQSRHFQQWPILGVYVWPNPAPLANTYQEEMDNTKQWIADRLAWMDSNLPGTCYPPIVGIPSASLATLTVSPQPAVHRFKVECSEPMEGIWIYDLHGKLVQFTVIDQPWATLELNVAGIYTLKVATGSGVQTQKVIITD